MNFAGKKWGGADQARKAIISKPNPASNIAAGYSFEDGEGNELPIRVGTGGFGPKNGLGFWSLFSTLATAIRSVVLADASGKLFPELFSLLAADTTNSTVVGASVPSFGVTLEASAIYRFDIVLRAQSAAVGTGLQFQITGPTSQIDWAVYEVEYMTGDTLAISNVKRQTIRALATNIAALEAPAANLDYLIRVRGMIKTTSTTPASDIGITFQSEVGGSQVTVRSGSWMRFRKSN